MQKVEGDKMKNILITMMAIGFMLAFTVPAIAGGGGGGGGTDTQFTLVSCWDSDHGSLTYGTGWYDYYGSVEVPQDDPNPLLLTQQQGPDLGLNGYGWDLSFWQSEINVPGSATLTINAPSPVSFTGTAERDLMNPLAVDVNFADAVSSGWKLNFSTFVLHGPDYDTDPSGPVQWDYNEGTLTQLSGSGSVESTQYQGGSRWDDTYGVLSDGWLTDGPVLGGFLYKYEYDADMNTGVFSMLTPYDYDTSLYTEDGLGLHVSFTMNGVTGLTGVSTGPMASEWYTTVFGSMDEDTYYNMTTLFVTVNGTFSGGNWEPILYFDAPPLPDRIAGYGNNRVIEDGLYQGTAGDHFSEPPPSPGVPEPSTIISFLGAAIGLAVRKIRKA